MMNLAASHLDFGYPWWLSYGHVVMLLPAAAFLWVGYRLKWPKAPMLLLGMVVLWSGTALLMTRTVLDINGRAALPTPDFFQTGKGRVLDLGAGTGRSSVMVLEARPQATLVASDLFGESFKQHFGDRKDPQQELLANLKAAGVEQRATIVKADMRELPFDAGSFDAEVSAYAMDHLNRKGIEKALSEAARVVKPGGDFLLILIANDGWGKFMYGPLLMHAGTKSAAWWTDRLHEAGFRVVEQGTQPVTLYLLARRL